MCVRLDIIDFNTRKQKQFRNYRFIYRTNLRVEMTGRLLPSGLVRTFAAFGPKDASSYEFN